MPRRNRCVLPNVPCHITQRGVDRREVFSSDQDRITYLRLVRENLEDAAVRILGYCLMSNHVHIVAIPAREDSLGVLFRRVHGRYAQYYNVHAGRSGHLWQNRFFACMLGIASVEVFGVRGAKSGARAGIVEHAAEYEWSSAAAHLSNKDRSGLLDMQWWQHNAPSNWADMLRINDSAADLALRTCTYARPAVRKRELRH
jgi:putative transposase